MLKGKEVQLRPVRRDDISFFLKWFNDPEVIQYLEVYLPVTEVGEEKWIEELCTVRANTDIVFVIEIIDGDLVKPIGNCGLHRIDWKNRVASLGIAIGEKDEWGKKYGEEALRLLIEYAFHHLNLHRISSGAVEFNERSIKLHKKLGFQEEGRLRKERFENGKYWDRTLFGLLKEEYIHKEVFSQEPL